MRMRRSFRRRYILLPASTPVHVGNMTDALAADVAASHGQRMNPLRLAEKRQRSIAMKQHESWSQHASKLDAESSPRERARADLCVAAGMAKPPPYSMLVTLSRDLLPATPHVTPAPLLAVRNDVAGAHAHKPDNEVALAPPSGERNYSPHQAAQEAAC